MNKVLLIGRLGKDPDIKYSADGKMIVNFSLATVKKFTDKDKNKNERTEWHNITAFGKLAEICGEYLKKGNQIYCEGEINYQEWDDKEGKKHWKTAIILSNMEMLGSKKKEEQTTLDDGVPF